MTSKALGKVCVGVDTSTKSVCLGAICGDVWKWDWIELKGQNIFEKLADAYQVTYEWIAQNNANNLIVYIEEPVYVNNGTTHMVLCCIYGAVVKAFIDWDIMPMPVNIQKWKKNIVGKGNAKKEEVRAYIVDRLDLLGDLDQDVYDALAISLYAKEVCMVD